MNIEQLEKTIRELTDKFDAANFIYDLLLAYGLPKASITRLRKGTSNLGKSDCDLLWKHRICYIENDSADLHELVDQLKTNVRVKAAKPRFVVVTDGATLLAYDTKTNDSLETPLGELAKHFDFFLPWAGLEKSQLRSESVADIRAAEKMGRLYDLILESNPPKNDTDRHSLNVFLARLLFCYFAEDTRIFAEDQFTKAISSHTAIDGSDLQQYLTRLFRVLAVEDRDDLPRYLADFPYVNGGLFCDEHPVPKFNAQSRKIIVECGSLNWRDINPDIFGSMIQAVVHSSERGNLGIHYTSVLNIMKVIEPLFLDELRAEVDKAGSNRKKLESLLERLYRIRVFDPACGSGNFLIIAYKELSKLEIEILQRIYGDQKSFQFESKIQLTQFYGIEIDGFAAETAKLSLWLAEHQMNLAFEAVFGSARPTLPLHDGGHIANQNATRIDWRSICPIDDEHEIYILGNPPYLGGKSQSTEQKSDMDFVFENAKNCGQLDYIASWFMKAARYVSGTSNARSAFVTTSSICQGSQVPQLWPLIFRQGVRINFAHKPFKWSNNAKGNAQITCSIIGLGNQPDTAIIYDGHGQRNVRFINAYLAPGVDVIVAPTAKPLSSLPTMITGNNPYDGKNLLLTASERERLIAEHPEVEKWIRPTFGSSNFLSGVERWCIWLEDKDVESAMLIPEIAKRIERTQRFRASGGEVARGLVSRSHQFRYTHTAKSNSIIVPAVSSEKREYIPIGFLDDRAIILHSAMAIYDPPPWVFGVVSSRLHVTWVRTVAGRLKTDLRYASALCYNTFPFPEVSEKQKLEIEACVFGVIDSREAHPEKTLSELYAPSKMPARLREMHERLDATIERCYRSKPFKDDDERIEVLLQHYGELVKRGARSDA